MRFPRFVPLYVFLTLSTLHLLAQSPDGNINGLVSDPSSAAVVGAEIVAINDVTGVQYTSKTNSEGIYVLSNLPPGPYRLQISKVGFKTIIKPDIVLNVQDALSINFTLPIGAAYEVLTVEGGAELVNAESAAVSTVVDQTYVKNMPLNGRSFQDLILLTPGVVTNTTQSQGTGAEFSVNGQRTESNVYTVDGVSANIGINALGAAVPQTTGSVAGSTALGTTQSLVSIDALQEFRVQSSTYSAEYGRNPGGQFSFVSRSGTNQLQGTAFDYLRNNVFDANDWFNGYFGVPKPPLRQNDFGGTLGGPFRLPFVYDGKDKTFFFLSYEGLRLLQPQAAGVSIVPTSSLRELAPSALQPVLNAFPVPNCPPGSAICTNDLGNGLGQFLGSWSDPSHIDSLGIRLDHAVGNALRLFFRFSSTSSSEDAQNQFMPSRRDSTALTTRTYTWGVTSSFSPGLTNEFRMNYSSNENTFFGSLTNFGGATAANLFELQGLGGSASAPRSVAVDLLFGSYIASIMQFGNFGEQRQWNIVDSLGLSVGRHQLRIGFDFRRLAPEIVTSNPSLEYDYFSSPSVQSNSVDYGDAISSAAAFPVYTNFSAFVQDEWRPRPQLTLSMGLRWEVNPAPSAAKGNLPYTTRGEDLSTLTLAPQGTSLWNTTWYNLAPRLGLAYVARPIQKWETVVRGGAGIFFDTGQQLGSYGYQGPGFSATNYFGTANQAPASFPLPIAQASPTIVNPPVSPYPNSTVYSFPAHLQLPYTLQWNASIEQALGRSQALTVSYVGANGRRLLEQREVFAASSNPDFFLVFFTKNGLTSDNNALQVQFQRRLTQGLQALASYSWAHSLDYGSQNASLPLIRGNSDYDIRNNFNTALSYDLSGAFANRFERVVLEDSGLDVRLTARTGFPLTLFGSNFIDPATGNIFHGGLDVVPGMPIYLYGSQCVQMPPEGLGQQCPGGRAVNPNAFSLPAGTSNGDAPRNFVRGFGAWQMDMALRHEFGFREKFKLQFRAEAFNLFNHPNFGYINPFFGQAGFGLAQKSLADSLGTLSPLYQTGGPRSMQLALKLIL